MASRIDTPCRECHEKGENFKACHDVCTTYQTAKAEYEREKKRIEEARRQAKIYDDYHLQRVISSQKIRNGKDRK